LLAFVAAFAAESAEAAAEEAEAEAADADEDAEAAALVAVSVAALTVALKAVVSSADSLIFPSSRWISFSRDKVALSVARAALSS